MHIKSSGATPHKCCVEITSTQSTPPGNPGHTDLSADIKHLRCEAEGHPLPLKRGRSNSQHAIRERLLIIKRERLNPAFGSSPHPPYSPGSTGAPPPPAQAGGAVAGAGLPPTPAVRGGHHPLGARLGPISRGAAGAPEPPPRGREGRGGTAASLLAEGPGRGGLPRRHTHLSAALASPHTGKERPRGRQAIAHPMQMSRPPPARHWPARPISALPLAHLALRRSPIGYPRLSPEVGSRACATCRGGLCHSPHGKSQSGEGGGGCVSWRGQAGGRRGPRVEARGQAVPAHRTLALQAASCREMSDLGTQSLGALGGKRITITLRGGEGCLEGALAGSAMAPRGTVCRHKKNFSTFCPVPRAGR